NPMDFGADHGLGHERVLRQLESSLERLGVDSVDLYLAHEFDPETALCETIEVFEELAASGRIGAYGVCNFDGLQLEEACMLGRRTSSRSARRSRSTSAPTTARSWKRSFPPDDARPERTRRPRAARHGGLHRGDDGGARRPRPRRLPPAAAPGRPSAGAKRSA